MLVCKTESDMASGKVVLSKTGSVDVVVARDGCGLGPDVKLIMSFDENNSLVIDG